MHLGDAGFDGLRQQGRSLSLQEAIELAELRVLAPVF
jgi:hypothetical protein